MSRYRVTINFRVELSILEGLSQDQNAFLYKIGEEGEADGQFSCPRDLCFEKYGDHLNLLVCDRDNERIQQFTMEGRFIGKTVIKLKDPKTIATTPDDRILVCDYEDKTIYILK